MALRPNWKLGMLAASCAPKGNFSELGGVSKWNWDWSYISTHEWAFQCILLDSSFTLAESSTPPPPPPTHTHTHTHTLASRLPRVVRNLSLRDRTTGVPNQNMFTSILPGQNSRMFKVGTIFPSRTIDLI